MRRIEANRQNARRSTGPKTATGKARVAQNAITHGLFSRQALLPDEDPQALEGLVEAIRTALNPEGPQEQLLVELMIDALWRRRRLGRVEAGIFSWKQSRILAERASREARTHEASALIAFSEEPDQPLITDPEKHQQAMVAAEQMRARGNEPTATIGLTFIRAASALMTLSRYETSLERSYYRALHELQRLQHARLGGHVPPPLALDVTVSGQDNDEAVPSGRLDSDGTELTTTDPSDSSEQSHGRDE
jgi:hypothetical protein